MAALQVTFTVSHNKLFSGDSRTFDPAQLQNQLEVAVTGVTLFRHFFVETLVVLRGRAPGHLHCVTE